MGNNVNRFLWRISRSRDCFKHSRLEVLSNLFWLSPKPVGTHSERVVVLLFNALRSQSEQVTNVTIHLALVLWVCSDPGHEFTRKQPQPVGFAKLRIHVHTVFPPTNEPPQNNANPIVVRLISMCHSHVMKINNAKQKTPEN